MSKGKTKMGNIGDDWKFLLGHRGEPPHWFSENLGVWPPCGHHWFPTSHRSSLESWGHLGVLDLEPPTFVGYDTSMGYKPFADLAGLVQFLWLRWLPKCKKMGHHSVHVTTSAILHQQKVPENSHVPAYKWLDYVTLLYFPVSSGLLCIYIISYIHIIMCIWYIYISISHTHIYIIYIYIYHIYIYIRHTYICKISHIYISHI